MRNNITGNLNKNNCGVLLNNSRETSILLVLIFHLVEIVIQYHDNLYIFRSFRSFMEDFTF